ncbi:pertactin-like passenger domain-containing protein [Pseudomonas lini]
MTSTTINDSSKWVLVDDSQVQSLILNNGGSVVFGADNAFYQLNVNNLSGNGRFVMGTDFATGQTDLLNVTGTATGNHELLIASSGVDPAAGQPIRVVQTTGGDAQFSLVNGAVDLGAFSYGLAKKVAMTGFSIRAPARSAQAHVRYSRYSTPHRPCG